MTSLDQRFHDILRGSYPIEISLGGFVGSAPTLMREGWQLSAEDSLRGMDRDTVTLRIAMKHPGIRQYAMAEYECDRNFMVSISSGSHERFHEALKKMRFYVKYMAPSVQFHIVGVAAPFKTFRTLSDGVIDTNFSSSQRLNLEDMIQFRTSDPTKDIYVPEHNVDDLLKLLLEKQEPAQAEIRAQKMRDQDRARRDEGLLWTPEKNLANLIILGA